MKHTTARRVGREVAEGIGAFLVALVVLVLLWALVVILAAPLSIMVDWLHEILGV